MTQLLDRIGHFCDIGRIGSVGFPTCQIVEGTDGEYGVVRTVAREVLVDNPWHRYCRDRYVQRDGSEGTYYYVLNRSDGKDFHGSVTIVR